MNLKSQKGITLMVLVITIVVMLIIAGASASVLFDGEGLLKTSEESKRLQENYANSEETKTNELINELDKAMETDGANPPKLKTGMIPVKYDETNKYWVVTNSKDREWYNYLEKRWANIMLTDGLQVEGITDASVASIDEMKGKKVTALGSMFVWIPRYAYKITSGYHQSATEINSLNSEKTAGEISIEFLKGTTNNPAKNTINIVDYNSTTTSGYTKFPDGYVVHPAFNYGQEVTGIWVAKFEASRKDSTASSGGSDETMLRVLPEVQSWVGLNIHKIYNKCIEYRPDLNSHLLKNSEWGAIAYLSQSSYGKNSEVWLNPGWTTGRSGSSVNTTDTSIYYPYDNQEYGVNASTTGNVTGVYDMSGTEWEYVAGYVLNNYSKEGGERDSETYGKSLIEGEEKTKDVYVAPEEESQINNYQYIHHYGDAVWETSSSSSSQYSWNYEDSSFPFNVYLFFVRGGSCHQGSRCGLFSFNAYGGDGNTVFRPVLVIL